MSTDYSSYEIDDFVMDDEFLIIAKNNDQEAFSRIIQSLSDFPVQREAAKEAFLLLNSLKIEQKKIPAQFIEKELQKLTRAGTKWRFLWTLSIGISVVAAAIAFLVVINTPEPEPGLQENKHIYAQLDSLSSGSGNIQLILANNEKVTFETDSASIVIQKDGSMQVNSSRIIAGNKTKNTSRMNQLIVPNGKRSVVFFEDGTRVWINSGTKILYPETFEKKREIYLDGEVYLEVAKNKHPFIVHTDKVEIEVLGTTFNVTAYKGEQSTNVILVEGKVQVTTEKGTQKELLPDELFSYTEGNITIREVDVNRYICWKDGVMIFDGTPLSEILTRVSRYYNITINYTSSLGSIYCKGKLVLTDSYEDVLENIALAVPVTFEQGDACINVSLNKSQLF